MDSAPGQGSPKPEQGTPRDAKRIFGALNEANLDVAQKLYTDSLEGRFPTELTPAMMEVVGEEWSHITDPNRLPPDIKAKLSKAFETEYDRLIALKG